MNCKPGDLAVVVRAETPGMLGRFVIVEHLVQSGECLENGRPIACNGLPAWIIRSAVTGERLPNMLLYSGRVEYVIRRAFADEFLRPIRPNEGEDESLSWAKPATHREGAPA